MSPQGWGCHSGGMVVAAPARNGGPDVRDLPASATIAGAHRSSSGSPPWPSNTTPRCRAPRSSACRREHTFFSWSVQGAVDPIAIDHAEGIYLYTPDGQRIIDFNSQLMSVNIGHGDRRVIDAITAQALKLQYVQPAFATEPRARLGPEARRDPARRHGQGLLHPRRRRGDRERDQARPPLHRAGRRSSPATARTTARRSVR